MLFTLEELLNIWVLAFAREHGSKKGIEWLEWTEEGLARHSETRELQGKEFNLHIKETNMRELKVEELEPPSEPQSLIWDKKIINRQKTNTQPYTMNLREKWENERKVTITASKEVALVFSFAASMPYENITASIEAYFGHTHVEESSHTHHQRSTTDIIPLNIPPNTLLHVKVTNEIQKIKKSVKCPVYLEGFVVVYCSNNVTYLAPYNQEGKHKLCIVPINQIFNDLERYAALPDGKTAANQSDLDTKRWITLRERDMLREWLTERNRFSNSNGRVSMLLEYVLEDSIYLTGFCEINEESLEAGATTSLPSIPIVESSATQSHSALFSHTSTSAETEIKTDDQLEEFRFASVKVTGGGMGAVDLGDVQQRKDFLALAKDAKTELRPKVMELQSLHVDGKDSYGISGDFERLQRLNLLPAMQHIAKAAAAVADESISSTAQPTDKDHLHEGPPSPNVLKRATNDIQSLSAPNGIYIGCVFPMHGGVGINVSFTTPPVVPLLQPGQISWNVSSQPLSYFTGRVKELESLQIILEGCDLHVLLDLPRNFTSYKNSYILIRSKNELHYVKPDGRTETVNIRDFSLFNQKIADILAQKPGEKLRLSEQQIEDLITSNGGQALSEGRNFGVISQSIVGLAGIGKSALAREYAQQSIQIKRYDFVVWMDATNRLSLFNDFQRLAQAFGMSNDQLQTLKAPDIINFVYDKLSIYPKVLLVFDDAHDLSMLQDKKEQDPTKKANFLPPQHYSNRWQWIVTTKNQYFSDPSSTIKLEQFTEQEAREYIQRRLPNSSDADADALAALLIYFPLALSQAIAYIQRPPPRYTIMSYIALYRKTQEDQRDLLNSRVSDDDPYKRTIYTTWKISIDELRKDKDTALSESILNICAYLAASPIPLQFIQASFPEEREVILQNALAGLASYSLIDWQLEDSAKTVTAIKVHALVQTVIRLQQLELVTFQSTATASASAPPSATLAPPLETDTAIFWLNKAFHGFNKVYPQEKLSLDEYTLIEYLIPHGESLLNYLEENSVKSSSNQVASILIQVIHLLIVVATSYGYLGNVAKQCELLERALVLEENSNGPDHIRVAKVLVILSSVYGDLGNTLKQQELIKRASLIASLEKNYDSHYGETFISILVQLGMAYGDLGNASKKCELLQQALEIQETIYGLNDKHVAETLTNLGDTYRILGNARKSCSLLERALKIEETTLNSRFPLFLAVILVNLSNAYGELGEYQKKCNLLERALKIQEQIYSFKHYKIAATLMSLGDTYCMLGNAEGGRKLLERALKIEEDFYGLHNTQVAITLNCLANVYGALGDAPTELKLLERALIIQEAAYGSNQVEVGLTLNLLGDTYCALENPGKGFSLLQRALGILESAYGPNHIKIATTLMNLGNAYGALNNKTKKCELLERALAIQESVYGPNDPQVAVTLVNLGTVYASLGNLEKGLHLLERALAIQETVYGPYHIQVAVALNNLGYVYGILKNSRKQCEVLERALSIKEQAYGPNHINLAVTLGGLANAYLNLQQVEKAYDTAQRARLIYFQNHYDLTHPNILKLQEFLQFCTQKKMLLCARVVERANQHNQTAVELLKANCTLQ